MAETNEHPERFDPAESSGTLMDAEHRCRYWWAAPAAVGKDVLDAACGTGYGSLIMADAGAGSVTGIDLSADAVSAAQKRLGDRGSAVQGDVGKLPFEADSFDLVVCLETIEHVADGAAVIAEFRRVLRPDGVLLISSPNPGIYPSGNEHHVHEYAPEELVSLVGAAFSKTVEHRQHPWIASMIRNADAGRTTEELAPTVKALGELEPGKQTYTLLAAGDSELPDLAALVTLGESFEVRWWQEHSEEIEEHFTGELKAAMAREHAAGERLGEVNGRLMAASEELSRLRTMEGHYAELRQISAHYDVAVTRLREIESSRGWILLNRLRGLLGRFRR